MRDVVGLYVDPPEHAVVFCVDEKPRIQALERTAPLLPMQPGQTERRSFDYRRHGTTSLFAALDVKTGKVLGQLHRRHRSAEFLQFLRRIDAEVPEDQDVHLILDNYSTHKAPRIRRWLARHPRFHLHFTPTYAVSSMSGWTRSKQTASGSAPPAPWPATGRAQARPHVAGAPVERPQRPATAPRFRPGCHPPSAVPGIVS